MELFLNDRKKGAFVVGCDEVGRGPLAGPVVACALYLPVWIEGIADSKKVPQDKRPWIAREILRKGKAFITISGPKTVDEENILRASLNAMRRAVLGLSNTVDRIDLVLIDGDKAPVLPFKTEAVVGGDAIHYCIAGASIVAKVFRDHLMDGYHENYPDYGFLSNKGYGTSEHLDALTKVGPCEIHRRSFSPCK